MAEVKEKRNTSNGESEQIPLESLSNSDFGVDEIEPPTADCDRNNGRDGFSIHKIAINEMDSRGDIVDFIYSRSVPEYIIYGAREKVLVHFCDNKSERIEQIRRLAPIFPLRDNLQYLIEDRRCDYREQIANALRFALDNEIETSKLLLQGLIDKAKAERDRIGRHYYLLSAGSVAAISAFLLFIGASIAGYFDKASLEHLLLASGGGALGALLSIAIAIRGRTTAPDHSIWANLVDGGLRIGIGILSGGAINLLLAAELADGVLATNISNEPAWQVVLIIGFAAGFLERLVPDLIERQGQKNEEAAA